MPGTWYGSCDCYGRYPRGDPVIQARSHLHTGLEHGHLPSLGCHAFSVTAVGQLVFGRLHGPAIPTECLGNCSPSAVPPPHTILAAFHPATSHTPEQRCTTTECGGTCSVAPVYHFLILGSKLFTTPWLSIIPRSDLTPASRFQLLLKMVVLGSPQCRNTEFSGHAILFMGSTITHVRAFTQM